MNNTWHEEAREFARARRPSTTHVCSKLRKSTTGMVERGKWNLILFCGRSRGDGTCAVFRFRFYFIYLLIFFTTGFGHEQTNSHCLENARVMTFFSFKNTRSKQLYRWASNGIILETNDCIGRFISYPTSSEIFFFFIFQFTCNGNNSFLRRFHKIYSYTRVLFSTFLTRIANYSTIRQIVKRKTKLIFVIYINNNN